MKKIIECPMCDGNAELQSEKKNRTFRKEEFEITEFFYRCNKCGEEFTTTEIDEVNIAQVFNQYREKYDVPFPRQLTEIKQEYGLNSTNFAKLLGFGVNQFAAYEKGEVPNQSNATLLSLCMDPKEMLKIVEKKKEILSESQYKNVVKRLVALVEKEKLIEPIKYYFNRRQIPDRFTGYQVPSFEKFTNMVLYFINNAQFKVRLNKLLFYADFLHFKNFGTAISGAKYAALPMGPVPDNYAPIFGLIERNGYVLTDLINDYEGLVPKEKFNKELFTQKELETMKSVLDVFMYKKTDEIVELSHQEKAWIDNEKEKRLISYQDYAFDLKAV
jgi:putative zinc finger/helix-turn-helix YgiT family protein